MNPKIELIKPETQAKLKKPVLITTGVIVVLGLIWLIIHITRTSGLGADEFYDTTSGTVVDTYGQGSVPTTNIVYGAQQIEEEIPANAYGSMISKLNQFVGVAYPNDQFSYKKNSLKKGPEDTYIFKIKSSKRELRIEFGINEENLDWLEVFSDKSSVYSLNK